MKSITFLLTSLLGAGSPLLAQSAAPPTEVVQSATNSFQLGGDEIRQVRADFNAGSYTKFLNSMDIDYQDAKKANGLEGLIEIRKEGGRTQIHPEFAHSFRVIQEQRNKQLVEATAGDESLFAQKVRSAATSHPSREESLISLYGKVPGTGKNSDENRLIDIDLEYYYKGIHLDADTKLSHQEKKQRHIALEMEKMDRMLKASQSFEDKNLKSAVERDGATLDLRLARNYDMSDLNALARGKIKPLSPLEERVATIVSRSQGDLAELHRQLINSLENNQTVQK